MPPEEPLYHLSLAALLVRKDMLAASQNLAVPSVLGDDWGALRRGEHGSPSAAGWQSVRARVRTLIRSPWFEAAVIVPILLNSVTLALFRPLEAPDSVWNRRLDSVHLAFLVLYTVEGALKIVAEVRACGVHVTAEQLALTKGSLSG